jgi:hypothetical protein
VGYTDAKCRTRTEKGHIWQARAFETMRVALEPRGWVGTLEQMGWREKFGEWEDRGDTKWTRDGRTLEIEVKSRPIEWWWEEFDTKLVFRRDRPLPGGFFVCEVSKFHMGLFAVALISQVNSEVIWAPCSEEPHWGLFRGRDSYSGVFAEWYHTHFWRPLATLADWMDHAT